MITLSYILNKVGVSSVSELTEVQFRMIVLKFIVVCLNQLSIKDIEQNRELGVSRGDPI